MKDRGVLAVAGEAVLDHDDLPDQHEDIGQDVADEQTRVQLDTVLAA